MMTRISLSYAFLFLLVFFAALAACDRDKTTTVSGTVIDLHTGEPIDSVIVSLRVVVNKIDPYGAFTWVLSDGNGKFSYTDEKPIQIYGAEKSGYLLRGPSVEFPLVNTGDQLDFNVDMIPRDGILKLILDNPLPSDTTYLAIYSALQERYDGIIDGIMFNQKVVTESMSTKILYFNLASGEDVDIYWGPQQYGGSSVNLMPNHATATIVRNDTTQYTILL